jgi:hypothetical protein
MSDDELENALFGEKTPGADTLIGGKKKPEETNEEEPEVIVKSKKPARSADLEQDKPDELDDDSFLDKTIGEEETEEEGTEKIKAKPGPKPAPVKKSLPTEAEPDYEALYNHFVKEGIWGEVELPEGAEWDAETFKEVQALQVTSRFDDLVNRTGPAGKMIIEYEANGGNPTNMVDLFKEQRAVQNYDVTTAEGQESFLREFYTAQGNSDKSVDRMVKSLVDQGPEVLREESDEKKALWDSQYQAEIETEANRQKLLAKQNEEIERNFQKNITQTVTGDAGMTPKEKRELRDYILNYNQNFNGSQVSQFYTDMVALQKDSANYVELAKFIKGLKNGDYKKKIADDTKKEVTAKTFLKIKGGSTLRSGGSGLDMNEEEGSNFVRLLQTKK